MKPVWVVDDDDSIRWVLERALKREGLAVQVFSTAAEALEALDEGMPQVLVSDIRMPGRSGLELLQTVKQRIPSLPVIIMTAYSDLESAVAAFQGGAFEYLAKPFDIDQAVELIRRALEESLREDAADDTESAVPEILGQAPSMQDVFRAIGRLSQSNVTVLLTGESGSGKEVVARALHKHSPRAQAPFVAINTAAIPKDLLESELFGHERGAFTGAQTMRRGRFEQAENGTLFLDEIGDMPAELQTRLLRVLSDGHFYRVGGHQPLRANVRVIAATHQDLEGRVRDGLFREDLYHRLNVIRLRLPPLRERAEDIPVLARYFLQKSAKELGVEPKRLADATVHTLTKLRFPGNVRQLENLCHWLTVMAPTQVVEVNDLPEDLRQEKWIERPVEPVEKVFDSPLEKLGIPEVKPAEVPVTSVVVQDWVTLLRQQVQLALQDNMPELMDRLTREFEKAMITEALRFTHGRKVDAAQRLGIGRNTITRKIQDFGLESKD